MVVTFLPRGHSAFLHTSQRPPFSTQHCSLYEPRIVWSYRVSGIIFFLKTSRVLPFARPSRAHIDADQWRFPCRRSGAISKRRRGSPCILITADRCSSPHGQQKVQFGFKKKCLSPGILLTFYCQPSLGSCLCESRPATPENQGYIDYTASDQLLSLESPCRNQLSFLLLLAKPLKPVCWASC